MYLFSHISNLSVNLVDTQGLARLLQRERGSPSYTSSRRYVMCRGFVLEYINGILLVNGFPSRNFVLDNNAAFVFHFNYDGGLRMK